MNGVENSYCACAADETAGAFTGAEAAAGRLSRNGRRAAAARGRARAA